MNIDKNISKNFSWRELLHSDAGKKAGIKNIPSELIKYSIIFLVTRLLQPLRELYGKQVQITSGYRCRHINQLVGGSPESQHMKGEAADCRTEDNEELLRMLRESGLEFDQAILYSKRNILHLSLKQNGKNRKMIICK